MNYLQQLINVRGLNCQDIADATGYGYHSIQKTVKGVRRHVHIREAIAGYLKLDPVKIWGKGSVIYLRHLVATEANRVADKRAKETREKFLKKYADSATLPASRKVVNV